jgi:hypothetical protein
MKTQHSGLIAIANADLAKKLDSRQSSGESASARSMHGSEAGQESPATAHNTKIAATFKQEIWRYIHPQPNPCLLGNSIRGGWYSSSYLSRLGLSAEANQ